VRALRASRLAKSVARVRTLRPGEYRVRGGWGCGRRQQAHFEALVPHELDTDTPMFSAAPISPEQWCGTNAKRMQQHADLARFRGIAAQPLALLPQSTGTTTADASSIHDAQTPISFSAVFMRDQFLVCRAPKRTIGLEGKILAREATGLPCGTHFWGSIAKPAEAEGGEGGERAGANSVVRNGCGLS
jgi:hypothetical protein